MFCQSQYDYGDENTLSLQQKEWICKGYISLISHTAKKQTPITEGQQKIYDTLNCAPASRVTQVLRSSCITYG